MVKIDKKDLKILYELRWNCRQTYNQLSKSVGISNQMIQYRINRLIELGVLEDTSLAIDAGRLGYQNYCVYFQWEDYNQKDAFVKDAINDPATRYLAEGSGTMDFIASFYAKTPIEFQHIWDKYISKYGASIRSHSIYTSTENHNFEKSYLIEAIHSKEREAFLGSSGETVEIDESDIAILKVLSHDARASIISIAKSCRLAPDTVKSRIKRMEKNGLIQGYGWLFNLEPLGIKQYELLLSLRNMDSETWGNLRSYCRTNPNITCFIRSIGEFDADIVFEVRNESEFDKQFYKLRKIFSKYIQDFEIIKIIKEHKFKYAPFL